jgi:hypothetical protein
VKVPFYNQRGLNFWGFPNLGKFRATKIKRKKLKKNPKPKKQPKNKIGGGVGWGGGKLEDREDEAVINRQLDD